MSMVRSSIFPFLLMKRLRVMDCDRNSKNHNLFFADPIIKSHCSAELLLVWKLGMLLGSVMKEGLWSVFPLS